MSENKLCKKTLVQIGTKFYSLKFELQVKSTQELKELIENPKYNLKLLKGDEDE